MEGTCQEQSKSKAEAKQSTIKSKGNSPEKIKAKAKAKQSNAMEGNSLGTCFLPMYMCAQRKPLYRIAAQSNHRARPRVGIDCTARRAGGEGRMGTRKRKEGTKDGGEERAELSQSNDAMEYDLTGMALFGSAAKEDFLARPSGWPVSYNPRGQALKR